MNFKKLEVSKKTEDLSKLIRTLKLKDTLDDILGVMIFLGIAWFSMELLVNLVSLYVPNFQGILETVDNITYVVAVVAIILNGLLGYARFNIIKKVKDFLELANEAFHETAKLGDIPQWELLIHNHPVKRFIEINSRTARIGFQYTQMKLRRLRNSVVFIGALLAIMAIIKLEDFDLLLSLGLSNESASLGNSQIIIDFGLILLPTAFLLVLSAYFQLKATLDAILWRNDLYAHYAEREKQEMKGKGVEFDEIRVREELCRFFKVDSVHHIPALVHFPSKETRESK